VAVDAPIPGRKGGAAGCGRHGLRPRARFLGVARKQWRHGDPGKSVGARGFEPPTPPVSKADGSVTRRGRALRTKGKTQTWRYPDDPAVSLRHGPNGTPGCTPGRSDRGSTTGGLARRHFVGEMARNREARGSRWRRNRRFLALRRVGFRLRASPARITRDRENKLDRRSEWTRKGEYSYRPGQSWGNPRASAVADLYRHAAALADAGEHRRSTCPPRGHREPTGGRESDPRRRDRPKREEAYVRSMWEALVLSAAPQPSQCPRPRGRPRKVPEIGFTAPPSVRTMSASSPSEAPPPHRSRAR
jgi:hypothetical protein